jgi:hypothetical protein
MDRRTHPFPAKLTPDQAEEIRRLRRDGAPLAELAGRFGGARSSISAIVKHKAHEPTGTLRLVLPQFERKLIEELAQEQEISVEQLAADLLVEMLRSRAL